MKLPRDLSGREFGQLIGRLGYVLDHQRGSHMRFTCKDPDHQLTVPDHRSLRAGTLASLLRQIMEQHNLDRDDLLKLLFD